MWGPPRARPSSGNSLSASGTGLGSNSELTFAKSWPVRRANSSTNGMALPLRTRPCVNGYCVSSGSALTLTAEAGQVQAQPELKVVTGAPVTATAPAGCGAGARQPAIVAAENNSTWKRALKEIAIVVNAAGPEARRAQADADRHTEGLRLLARAAGHRVNDMGHEHTVLFSQDRIGRIPARQVGDARGERQIAKELLVLPEQCDSPFAQQRTVRHVLRWKARVEDEQRLTCAPSKHRSLDVVYVHAFRANRALRDVATRVGAQAIQAQFDLTRRLCNWRNGSEDRMQHAIERDNARGTNVRLGHSQQVRQELSLDRRRCRCRHALESGQRLGSQAQGQLPPVTGSVGSEGGSMASATGGACPALAQCVRNVTLTAAAKQRTTKSPRA